MDLMIHFDFNSIFQRDEIFQKTVVSVLLKKWSNSQFRQGEPKGFNILTEISPDKGQQGPASKKNLKGTFIFIENDGDSEVLAGSGTNERASFPNVAKKVSAAYMQWVCKLALDFFFI